MPFDERRNPLPNVLATVGKMGSRSQQCIQGRVAAPALVSLIGIPELLMHVFTLESLFTLLWQGRGHHFLCASSLAIQLSARHRVELSKDLGGRG